MAQAPQTDSVRVGETHGVATLFVLGAVDDNEQNLWRTYNVKSIGIVERTDRVRLASVSRLTRRTETDLDMSLQLMNT